MSGTNLLLGAIAGLTIFLGLPVARWKNAPEWARGLLALMSAGVLLFLIIEIGYHAMESVEGMALAGEIEEVGEYGLLLVGGFAAGLMGLAWIEGLRAKRRQAGASSFELAAMIALGIGLHNFAEGLAIGQSFAGGAAKLGVVLVVGFALHNATEGFGIAAPLAGERAAWGRLLLLGLIGGAPTALGAAVGGIWVNEGVELVFLAMALGSLIYVTRELLRLRFDALSPVAATAALAFGLFFGFGTEVVAEVGLSRSAVGGTAEPVAEVHFAGHAAEPAQIVVAQGDTVVLENGEETALVFEGEGLFPGEVVVPSHSEKSVTVRGREGSYQLVDERGRSATLSVVVRESSPQTAKAD